MEPYNEGFCLLLGQLKVTQKNGQFGGALEGTVSGDRCLSFQKSVWGQLACGRTPPKFQLEKRRLLSFYVLYGGLVFLILIFFLRA